MADQTQKLHIAMLPWLAFGHMIPFLDFAKNMAQKGHRVSYLATPRNIQRLPKLPPHLADSITFVQLPLHNDNNLPENAEASMDLPPHNFQDLKGAYHGLQEEVTQFLENFTPDWIIYDILAFWLPPITAKLGISRGFFNTNNAWNMSFFGSSIPEIKAKYDPPTKPEDMTVPPKWVTFPTSATLRLYEAKYCFFHKSNGSTIAENNLAVSGCEVIIVRSCMELEPEWLKLLKELQQKPVVPVGLLPPTMQVRQHDHKDDTWDTIVEWLDTQEKGSVVYVALGSEVRPSQEDLKELALGLELSGLPFFWALRKRSILGDSDSIELPDGFEDRIKGRGVVYTSWVPQPKILAHDSVGGFLTHGGWGSVIEGLYFARPLIMLPYYPDQGLNARILEEKKAGVEVPRNEQDGSFTRNAIANSLKLVMIDDEGKIYWEGARKLSSLIGDEDLHYQYIDKLTEFLEKNRSSVRVRLH